MAATLGTSIIEHYLFADDGDVPNNPRLPLIVYRGALESGGDAAASCVALFDRQWLDRRLEERGLFAPSLSQQRA